MKEFDKILNMIQTILDLFVKNSITNKITGEGLDLRYISDSFEDFDNRLFEIYGIRKQDLIKHMAFEIYCEIIQQNIRLKQKNNSLEGLLKKYFDDKEIEKNRINNYRNKKAKPYLNRYKYLSYDNMLDSGVESLDLFWNRISFHRGIFSKNNVSNNFNIVPNNKGRYNILDFQSYFYSCIICNYTEKNKIIGKMVSINFSEINLKEYINFIREIYEIVKEKEEYKTISYYMIEKEFSPILISKMFALRKANIIDERIMRNGWYTTMNPILFHNSSVMDSIVKQNYYSEKDTIANKYQRYPLSLEIGLLRMYKEFFPMLYLTSYGIIQEEYKEDIYNAIELNKVKFESIYANLEEDLENSIRLLDLEVNNKKSQEIFKSIMSCKENVYTEIGSIMTRIKLYNEKVKEYEVSKNKDDLGEGIYQKEDIEYIINNNILLKIISGL